MVQTSVLTPPVVGDEDPCEAELAEVARKALKGAGLQGEYDVEAERGDGFAWVKVYTENAGDTRRAYKALMNTPGVTKGQTSVTQAYFRFELEPAEPPPPVQAEPAGPPPSQVLREALAVSRERRAAVMAGAMVQAEQARSGALEAPAGKELVPVRGEGINGAELLAYVRAFCARFCAFPSEAALDAVVLWVAACHATDPDGVLIWEASGRLMFLSSQPGSGKSRALSLVAMLTGSTFGLMTEPTMPAVADVLGEHHEVACVDEGDVLFGAGARRESLRALFNSGYQRMGTVPHKSGGKTCARPCFGPLAIAALDSVQTATSGRLASLFSRSHVIHMIPAGGRLAAPGRDGRHMAGLLHQAMTAWCAGIRDALEMAKPEVPEHLVDRDWEIWLPLFAIAEAAGGEWPARAWKACDALTQAFGTAATDEETDGLMDEIADFTVRWASRPKINV